MSYNNLEVYKLSYEMALKVHKLTMKFPKHETWEVNYAELQYPSY
jgi:hypothetical protein